MRVFLLIGVLATLILNSEAQWDRNNFNRTRWDQPQLNRTQWNQPQFSRTQWSQPQLNRTRWNQPQLNRTRWNQPNLNRTQWDKPDFNRTQWKIDALDRWNGRFQSSNNTLWNSSRYNGSTRTKREEPRWVVPWDRNNFNKTQWDQPELNRTQWNQPHLNRTRWNTLPLNGTHWNRPDFNRTQWKLDALDRFQINANNRNSSRHNRNTRIKREEPKWVVPAAVPIINATVNQTTHNGDLIVGQIGFLDRLLFNQTYKKERRWWSGREKIIEYPNDLPGKNINRQETITAIRIYNKFYDGLEANAEILSGGVGYRYAKIRISSPWNRGFQYLVQIYGR